MIDALAAESVNYAQAVTPHPFGPFARAALLTGVRSPENGVRDYFDALPAESRTIAHAMRERGYATAFFGKWGVGQRDPRVPLVGEAAAKVMVPEGARGGFEVWDGFEGGFLLNDPWLHGTRNAEPVRVPGYQSDVVGAQAARWIALLRSASFEGRGGGDGVSQSLVNRGGPSGPAMPAAAPWFCVVSLEAPHPPYDAPASGVEQRTVELAANVPRGGEVEAKARRELAGYYAHIEATDRAIGRLVAGVGKDTVVVFTSVHGDMHGAHGFFRKGWPHEESVRVPLIVRPAAGQGTRGTTSPEAVSLADLPAMTLAWAEGRTWSAARSGAEISMPSVVRVPQQCDRVWRGWRSRTRKLVLDEAGVPWLFFDLERDPLELKNLVDDPARAAEIAALVRELK